MALVFVSVSLSLPPLSLFKVSLLFKEAEIEVKAEPKPNTSEIEESVDLRSGRLDLRVEVDGLVVDVVELVAVDEEEEKKEDGPDRSETGFDAKSA